MSGKLFNFIYNHISITFINIFHLLKPLWSILELITRNITNNLNKQMINKSNRLTTIIENSFDCF